MLLTSSLDHYQDMLSYNYKQITVAIMLEISVEERKRHKIYRVVCEFLRLVQGTMEMLGS